MSTALRRGFIRESKVLLAAWRYFSIVPLPRVLRAQATKNTIPLQDAARYAPLIGSIIAGLAGLVFVGVMAIIESKSIAIMLSILTMLVLSGAMYEAGAARFFEAFCTKTHSAQELLTTLSQHTLGTVGVLTLVLSVLLRYVTLLQIDTALVPVALIVAHSFSRFAALSFVFTNVRADDTTAQAQSATHPIAFMTMAALGMVPLLLVGNLLFLLLVPLLWIIRALIGVWFTQKVGGWTPQSLGAVQVLCEVSTYILLAIAIQYAFTNF
jgi:adenosylcobinamide-GDP ribazoletransferase